MQVLLNKESEKNIKNHNKRNINNNCKKINYFKKKTLLNFENGV